MKLSGKTILIAGASSGIGRACAIELSRNNNHLIVCARRKDKLEDLAKDIHANGSTAQVEVCDVLDQDNVEALLKRLHESDKPLDLALLNVGDGPAFNMNKVSVTEVRDNLDINYQSLVNFLIPLIALMKNQGHGIIAHTNSLAGFIGLPMQGPYSAAKAACRLLMDSCRIELEQHGLKFVSLYPGFVATERVAEDGIPAPFEISEQEAARYMIRGIEKEKNDVLFPFVTASLVRLARVLPKPLLGYILKKSVPEDY
ncbi:SDR family NAD(P)-dependent oxidoreductase [Pseudoteredinibacter isoporae]|uniref:Short-subunit dehydrogenase n=1 Tax=Pseudoteredinibacter isoporae TaxID=570281 RepID=A0A7X0JT61_9GAMM|nr:SDR family NAD(P)-dependent oxidoreductase [Pseudoteredinibacter isoporae]MBB6521810.1 short-subunit dehydrogenase [Pseudoteredinibacter isoporae]NHO87355.1 SDR family NAD(P)-dependent oxidoreductase [Pseudoteredinibacter isoporae]NIB23179.1 SDR family NAD(P)-dependent oxidoreductase [Pseudoteredinibacter isoporae]